MLERHPVLKSFGSGDTDWPVNLFGLSFWTFLNSVGCLSISCNKCFNSVPLQGEKKYLLLSMCLSSHFISFKYSEQVVALLSLALQFQPGAYCTRYQEEREGADGQRIPRKEQADVLHQWDGVYSPRRLVQTVSPGLTDMNNWVTFTLARRGLAGEWEGSRSAQSHQCSCSTGGGRMQGGGRSSLWLINRGLLLSAMSLCSPFFFFLQSPLSSCVIN